MQERKNRGGPLRNRQVLGVVSDPEMKGGKFCRVCRARGRARLPEFSLGKKRRSEMKRVILLAVLILLISSSYSLAEVPCKINYQGRLIKDNVPVNGTRTMRFSIYDSATAGSQLWTSRDVNVTVYNGLFRVVLDLEGVDWTAGQELYLEVKAGDDILSPRERIYAYPYAINTHLLEGKTTAHFLDVSSSTQTKQGGLNILGNVGIGTTSPSVKLHIDSGGITSSPIAAIRIVDGNQAAGKVLTSDANGVGRWGVSGQLTVCKFKTTDQTISSGFGELDNDLQYSIGSGEEWNIEVIATGAGTNGLSMCFDFPTGKGPCGGILELINGPYGTASHTWLYSVGVGFGGGTSNQQVSTFKAYGRVKNTGASAAIFGVKWWVLSGTATVFGKGSFLRLTKVN